MVSELLILLDYSLFRFLVDHCHQIQDSQEVNQYFVQIQFTAQLITSSNQYQAMATVVENLHSHSKLMIIFAMVGHNHLNLVMK